MSQSRVPKSLREKVARAARYRCGYCLSVQTVMGASLEIDHLVPEAEGGPTVEENLWLACSECNNHKSSRQVAQDPYTGELAPLFNPRKQRWYEHFRWTDEGDYVIGLTPTGRATVAALQLNRQVLVDARRLWVKAGWHPPKD